MSIRINKEKCVGCGKCANVCPGTLISVTDGCANIDYPKDCWGCASCLKECAFGAIDFYLGEDIGGKGSVMNVVRDGDILHWNITSPVGITTVIDVNRRNANQY